MSGFYNIAHYLSSDIAFLLFLFVVLFALIMYLGKARAISLIIAFYPATLLFRSFPLMSQAMILKGDNLLLLNKVGLFLLFLVPIYYVISRFVSHYEVYDGGEGFIRTGGFTIALLILLVLFSYTTINLDSLHNFGAQIDTLFSGSDRIFGWDLAPLILLAFL